MMKRIFGGCSVLAFKGQQRARKVKSASWRRAGVFMGELKSKEG
jgi:hypothetical protein